MPPVWKTICFTLTLLFACCTITPADDTPATAPAATQAATGVFS